MSIRTKFALPDEPGKPSSGDGASVESKYDPNTGLSIPGYQAPSPSARQDAEQGGLSTPLSDNRNHQRDYRETAAASQGIHPDGGGGGVSLPTSVDGFRTSGSIPADSNYHSAVVIGTPDRLEVNDTLPKDSNQTAGGRPVA